MDVDTVRKAAQLIHEAHSMLEKGPLDFYLTEMAAAYELLMTRYAPFKIGEWVRLRVTPELSPSWLPYQALLVIGAVGIVTSSDCGSKGFRFFVVFGTDGEFWFDENSLEAF